MRRLVTYPGLQDAWTAELEQADATQNFLNGTQNYPLLKGMQSESVQVLPAGGLAAGQQPWGGRLSTSGRAV